MKNIFTLIAFFALMFNSAFAQELSKEEKKRLKEELKAHLKDIEGYKAKMEDIRTTLDSNDAEIRRLKDDVALASAQVADLDNKVADYIKELERCHEENNILRGNPVPNGDTTLVKEIMTSMNNVPKEGTVYKVQIGLYEKFNVNKYFQQPRYIGYEDVNGLNRYIISYFTDEAVALQFVEDVRRMGIRDAFVAKYIDGERVYEWTKNPKYEGKLVPNSLQEAIELNKPKRKAKKVE